MDSQEVACPECGKTCGSNAGLAIHRKARHGIEAAQREDRLSVADWSDDEWMGVAQEFMACRTFDLFTDATEMFQKAQVKVLPQERRPVMRQLTSQIRQKIQDLYIELMETPREIEVPVIVERPAPAKPVDWEHELERVPLPALLEMVGRKLGNVLEGFRNIQTINTYANKPKEEPPKVSPPKVAIFGLLPDQQNNMRELYTGPFELQFMRDARNVTVPIVDWVIVHKHSGHCVWDRARSQIDSSRVVFSSGGLSDCLRVLGELEKRQERAVIQA